AADADQHGTSPDPAHERFDVQAHAPGAAVVESVAHGDIKIAEHAGLERYLGHGLAAAVVEAFLRRHVRYLTVAAVDGDPGFIRAPVGALDLGDFVQSETVARCLDGLAGRNAHFAFK